MDRHAVAVRCADLGRQLMPNKFRGEVAAPEFGDGYTIRLDVAGQAELETQFGNIEFAQKVHLGLAVISVTYLLPFLRVALRQDDKLVSELPEIPLPLAPIAVKCLDAFCLFREGKDAETLRAEAEAIVAAPKAPKANPTKGTKA